MLNNTARAFEDNLMKLINSCGLSVSEAYYIVQNAALQLKNVYDELVYKEQFEGSQEVNTATKNIPVEYNDVQEEPKND